MNNINSLGVADILETNLTGAELLSRLKRSNEAMRLAQEQVEALTAGLNNLGEKLAREKVAQLFPNLEPRIHMIDNDPCRWLVFVPQGTPLSNEATQNLQPIEDSGDEFAVYLMVLDKNMFMNNPSQVTEPLPNDDSADGVDLSNRNWQRLKDEGIWAIWD